MTQASDIAPGQHFLLVKRGLYYRPNNQGYTGIKENAGRYHESDASPDSGVHAIHESDAPIYAPGTFHDIAAHHFASKVEELAGQQAQELLEHAKALATLLAGFPDGKGLAVRAELERSAASQ